MILSFLTGVGILLFGVSIMSSSFEKICGSGIRKTLNKFSGSMTKNSIFGAIFTIVLQSNTATVSLFAGLAGASVVTLFQSICLIMGSNIGAALHTILVAFSEVNIIGYFGLLTLVGVFIRLFGKKSLTKNIGQCICGLGLVFVGLSLMSSAANELSQTTAFTEFFFNINNAFILFCLGLVLSALVNSSLGMTAIIASILTTTPALLSLQNASYIIYAMNIGTCITPLIIGLTSGNRKTLKAMLSYIIFNIIGAILFSLITIYDWVTPVTSFLGNATFQVIFINIIFNVVTFLIMLPLTKPLEKLLNKLIPDKDEATNQISRVPTLGFAQLNKNALDYFSNTVEYIKGGMNYIVNTDTNLDEITSKILADADNAKNMNDALLKIGGELNDADELNKRDLNNIFIGIEKTDINTIKLINSCYYNGRKITFTQKQLKTISSLSKLMNENLIDMQEVMKEIIPNGSLESTNLLQNIVKRLEKMTRIKVRAKKSVIEDSVSMTQKINRYTCFLNVINYFEQITTNLTDILLNISSLRPQKDVSQQEPEEMPA